MFHFVKRLWKTAPLATLVLAVSLFAAGVFSARATAHSRYWNSHTQDAKAVQPWMTLGYIAHSWGISKTALQRDLHLHAPPPPRKPRTLKHLAKSMNMPVQELVTATQKSVVALSAQHPTSQATR